MFKTTFAYGYGGGYPKSEVLPGHQYLVDLQERESVYWWKEGRKEDVLYVPGQKNRSAFYSDGKPIPLSLEVPVELAVLPARSTWKGGRLQAEDRVVACKFQS